MRVFHAIQDYDHVPDNRRKGVRRTLLLSAMMLASGMDDDAFGQDTSLPGSTAQTQASGIISYPPDFFTDGRPSSVLDMVQRIPGFLWNVHLCDRNCKLAVGAK